MTGFAATYIQPGNTITVQAPAGGMTDGQAYLIGDIFGVAVTPVRSGGAVLVGEDCELETVGVHELPKTTGNALAQGDRAYWDDIAKEITGIAGSHKYVGTATKIAASGATKLEVRFNGVAI